MIAITVSCVIALQEPLVQLLSGASPLAGRHPENFVGAGIQKLFHPPMATLSRLLITISRFLNRGLLAVK